MMNQYPNRARDLHDKSSQGNVESDDDISGLEPEPEHDRQASLALADAPCCPSRSAQRRVASSPRLAGCSAASSTSHCRITTRGSRSPWSSGIAPSRTSARRSPRHPVLEPDTILDWILALHAHGVAVPLVPELDSDAPVLAAILRWDHN